MLLRILQIALGLSFFLMAGLYIGRGFLPRVFTDDPAVIAIAGRVFPILAAFMVNFSASIRSREVYLASVVMFDLKSQVIRLAKL